MTYCFRDTACEDKESGGRQYNEQTFHLLMRSVFFEHFRRGTVKCGDSQCYEGRYDKDVRRQYVEQRQRYGVVGVYIYQTVAEADCKALEPEYHRWERAEVSAEYS